MVLGLMLAFQTADRLIPAFGFSVNLVLLLTTVLFSMVLHYAWNIPWWQVGIFPICFGFIEGCFLIANCNKVPDGAWVAIVFGLCWAIIMLCWVFGTRLVTHELQKIPTISVEAAIRAIEATAHSEANPNSTRSQDSQGGHIEVIVDGGQAEKEEGQRSHEVNIDGDQVEKEDAPTPVEPQTPNPAPSLEVGPDNFTIIPMTVIFVSSTVTGIPASFRYFLSASHTLPENIIFLYVKLLPVPRISAQARISVLQDGRVTRLICRFGFSEKLEIVDFIENSPRRDEFMPAGCKPSYYFGREDVVVTKKRNILFRIPLHVFKLLLRNSSSLVQELSVPSDRVLDIGLQVYV